jgi:hypothetical protein
MILAAASGSSRKPQKAEISTRSVLEIVVPFGSGVVEFRRPSNQNRPQEQMRRNRVRIKCLQEPRKLILTCN